MKFTRNLMAAALFFSFGVNAQTAEPQIKRNCASVPTAEWDAWFNQKVEEHQKNLALGKTQSSTYTIPVVVHIVHGGQAVGTYPNVSQAQIISEISVMNADYSGAGYNVSSLAATGFSAVGAADCGISFCLAQRDQDGNVLAEPGIDRVNYVSGGWANPASFTGQAAFQSYVDGTLKPNTIWDPYRYFNIWITDVNSGVGLLGYATFPIGTGLSGLSGNGTASTDGIWVWTKSFGSTGSVQAPYNMGRTATHETGHWLGLRHIWGDSNCGNDYVNDTPLQKTDNFGCLSYPAHTTAATSCPGGSPYGDMFMNFMDYTDDACLSMFTPGQSARMTTAMTYGTYRTQLTASSATLCNLQATMPTSSFNVATDGCVDSLMATTNQSSGSPAPGYAWSALPNLGIQFTPNNTSATPNIKFALAGTYTITMQAFNAAGNSTTSKVVTIEDCTSSSPTTTTGIKSNSNFQKSISIYPNPSSGIVNIATTLAGNQNLNIEVNNYLGQHITSITYNNVTANTYKLDMNNYPDGVYFITFSNGQEKVVKRLILNK